MHFILGELMLAPAHSFLVLGAPRHPVEPCQALGAAPWGIPFSTAGPSSVPPLWGRPRLQPVAGRAPQEALSWAPRELLHLPQPLLPGGLWFHPPRGCSAPPAKSRPSPRPKGISSMDRAGTPRGLGQSLRMKRLWDVDSERPTTGAPVQKACPHVLGSRAAGRLPSMFLGPFPGHFGETLGVSWSGKLETLHRGPSLGAPSPSHLQQLPGAFKVTSVFLGSPSTQPLSVRAPPLSGLIFLPHDLAEPRGLGVQILLHLFYTATRGVTPQSSEPPLCATPPPWA